MTARPTKPVPPVTKTRRAACMGPRISILLNGDDKIEIVSLARALCLTVVTLAVVAFSVVPAATPQVISDLSGIDEAMTDAVKSGEIPGAVVLVGRGDETLYFRAAGSRRLVPDPLPMTRETVFDIASLTKPFATTLAVMSLIERGDIRLDYPVGHYVKEFRRKEFEGVTIRRLLTHTAGLVAIPASGSVNGGFPRAAAALAKLPLDFPPGQSFQYSDTGFLLLGEVVG